MSAMRKEAASLALPGDARLPLYHRLARHIQEAVARQQWRPGERLPSEGEFAARLGVAVGTVRQAVADLVRQGLLVRRQGKGTFVHKPTFDSSLFRFWRFCDKDGERKPPESRILARRRVEAPAEVRQRLDLPPGEDAVFLSRLRLWDGKPVVAEEIWLPHRGFSALLELPADKFGPLLYPAYESVCGKYVARAEERLAARAATAKQARAVGVARGAPIVVIGRLARGYDDAPLEWRIFWGCASRFQYRIEIR